MTNDELESVGMVVAGLLIDGAFETISANYDYALRFGRPASIVIKEDYAEALDKCIGKPEMDRLSIRVSHFTSNETQLKSLIECDFTLDDSTGILVELIRTSKNDGIGHTPVGQCAR